MHPALNAASVVTMANTGKMRGSVAESSKKSAVSKLLLKPTRLPKTAVAVGVASSGVKGRDNLGFVPGSGGGLEGEMEMASPGTLTTPRPSSSAGANDPLQCHRVENVDIALFEQTTNCGGPAVGARQRLSAVAERQSPSVSEGRTIARGGCGGGGDEMVPESTPPLRRRTPEVGVYQAGSLSAVRNERRIASNALPLSKCGSTTALETLSSRRSESPIYEELDFKCSSFRDLNSDPSRRLESPNVSDSSAELSNNPRRRGLPFPSRHLDHRGQYSSPSCGVRIAEMRATRKYDGLRTSPSSTTTKPIVQHQSIDAGLDRRRSQPSGKGSPAPTAEATLRWSSSSQCQRAENHRSSLDLNVTYVEYFDETRPSPSGSSQTTTPSSVCSPVASSHSSSVSSLADAPNRTSSTSSPLNFLRGHRRTATPTSLAAEWDCQAARTRTPPKFIENSTQTGGGGGIEGGSRVGGGGGVTGGVGGGAGAGEGGCPAKEKRQIRPIGGFTGGSENRLPAKSSALRKPSESQRRLTGLTTEVDSSSGRLLSVRRSMSEPDGRGACEGSGSNQPCLNSTDTLIDSEMPSPPEDTTTNDDLASSEGTDDDDNCSRHSIRGEVRPSLGIRAAQKRPPQPRTRVPPPSSQLQGGPTTTQRRQQPDRSQSTAFKSSKSSSTQQMALSASCLVTRQATTSQQQQQLNHPAPSASTSPPTKLNIQRIENFGEVTELKNKVSVTQPIRLSKSTSSTDLNRNVSSHLQAPISSSSSRSRNKPVGNMIGLQSDCTSAPKTQNPRPKIPPSPTTSVRTIVRRVQQDSRSTPVSNHSSAVGVSSSISSKSGSRIVSTAKRDSGSASIRSDERSRIVGCQKDSLQSTQPQPRSITSNAPVASANKLMRQHTVPPSEGSGRSLKPCGRLPSASDNLVIPFSLQQQQLSPIAERSPQTRTSTSSGESISGNVARNCRGQIPSPRVLPFSGQNPTAPPQFYRNLSSSQRALSMSKISSAKSAAPSVTSGGGISTKCSLQRPSDRSDDGVASVSSTTLVSEDIISKNNELLSRSYANIFEQSSAAKENSPSMALQKTASGGRRLNTASCVALNVSPETRKPLQNKVPPDYVRARQSTITDENDPMRPEVNSNCSSPPSSASVRTPETAMLVDAKESRGIPVRAERTKESKPSGIIAESTGLTSSSSRLRTPTDFNRKSEKNHHDREMSGGGARTSTGQTISEGNEESEAVTGPAAAVSVFKQLQMKHVKPYTSASNRGTSIAEKFARSRSTIEAGNASHKMAASVERNSSANSGDPKTNIDAGVSLAMPCKAPITQATGIDSCLVTSNIPEQEIRSDILVLSSQPCELYNTSDAALKTKARDTCQREDDVGSSCENPELSSLVHSVSGFEGTETWTSDGVVKMDSCARNDDDLDENLDIDTASCNAPVDTNLASQEIDSRSVPMTRTLSDTDHTQVKQAPISEPPMAMDASAPDLNQLLTNTSDIRQVSVAPQTQSENSRTAESGTNADTAGDPYYAPMSTECMLSDADHSSVQLSGDELFSETDCFDSTTMGGSDCDVASDFSEKTLQRDHCKGVSGSDCSMEQGTSVSIDVHQPDVTDAETLTDEDCRCSYSATDITNLLPSDLSTSRKVDKIRMDHGSQTTPSDIGCLGDRKLIVPSKRNSLILQNKIIVDQDNPLRDIEKFVVTYESENIIVLERADSISCPAPLATKDEFKDKQSRSELPASLTSTELSQKWGKNSSMSPSRSVDLRMVTSPKGESGNLPLSESGYDSWKSQSSKSSSMRFLKLSDSETCALSSAGSNPSETVNRRSGLEGSYDRRCKESELRCSGIQPRIGASAGYPDGGWSAKGRPGDVNNCATHAEGVNSSLTSRKCGSFENRLKFGSSGSETEVNLRQEISNNACNIRRLGFQSPNDISTGEIDASCTYFQDDDDLSLTPQSSATVEDCFRGEDAREDGGGFSSSFSSFPSSSSSLMDTLESLSFHQSDSNEGFAEVWSAITIEGTMPKEHCLHPTEEKTAWNVCGDLSDQHSGDLIDLTCGSCYELSSNAAAFHSRDYHNRIYKLDFGAGDSGDLAADPEDLGDELEDPLLPSSTWLEEGQVQSIGKISSDQSANSTVKHRQFQSLNCSNSKSGPLRPSSKDFSDQNSKHSIQPDDVHFSTFPLAVRKVLSEGVMRKQEEARAVAEDCRLVSKLNVKSRRKQEKETFYENMCDELLENLEANLSDSDNTPSPTARDLGAIGDELTCAVESSGNSAATSREKRVLLIKKTISSAEDEAVLLTCSDVTTLTAKDKRTSTDFVPHNTLIASVEPSERPDSKTYDGSERVKQREAAAPSDGSLGNRKELLWVSQYCVEKQKPDEVRLSMVDCEETYRDTQLVRPGNCSLAEGSLKEDSTQRPNASSLATLPLAEAEVVVTRSNECSPSDAVKTFQSKDAVKSGSSASLLTRYFPGLLRRQSKDHRPTTSPEIAERRSGLRRHDETSPFTRNSAPVSYDRKSKDIAEQEPRSVRDVIRKFEDKTAAQTVTTAGQEGSRSSRASSSSSTTEDHKGNSGKRSKFSKKAKS